MFRKTLFYSVRGMEFEQITCVLELAAVVCYGFLILALVLYWPNEANTYLLLFCLSNGILALVAAYNPKENNDLCRWNGLLTLFALTLGFDSLHRSQHERKRMAEHEFRFYRNRTLYTQMFRSCIISTIVSFAAFNHYNFNPTFQMCFFKASESAKLDETMISFFWILFFYVRPIAMIVKLSPRVVVTCYRQIKVLQHEKKLNMNGKLFLYKDHHRRLFHVIFSVVVQVVMVVWFVLTGPYVIQMISMVAGLNVAIRLDELSVWSASIIIYLYRFLPLISCFLLISAFAINLSLKFKG